MPYQQEPVCPIGSQRPWKTSNGQWHRPQDERQRGSCYMLLPCQATLSSRSLLRRRKHIKKTDTLFGTDLGDPKAIALPLWPAGCSVVASEWVGWWDWLDTNSTKYTAEACPGDVVGHTRVCESYTPVDPALADKVRVWIYDGSPVALRWPSA